VNHYEVDIFQGFSYVDKTFLTNVNHSFVSSQLTYV
jgi:hypothetical protein